MAIIRNNKPKPTIDLASPQGNAFALIGIARNLGKQLGWTQEKFNQVERDMTPSNYEHLIEVFGGHFGQFVDLVFPEAT